MTLWANVYKNPQPSNKIHGLNRSCSMDVESCLNAYDATNTQCSFFKNRYEDPKLQCFESRRKVFCQIHRINSHERILKELFRGGAHTNITSTASKTELEAKLHLICKRSLRLTVFNTDINSDPRGSVAIFSLQRHLQKSFD